jgi:hypothetical protein
MVAGERRGKGWVRRVIGVVGRVYDDGMERARKCAKAYVFATEIYNMEIVMKLSVIAMMLLMSSCAASGRAPAEPWSVRVTSSGGIAGRGAGTFAIDSDGGIAVTTMTGKSCTFRATDDEMRRFRELLSNAHPESWSESYIPKESCCDRFEYELTLDEAGKKHTVKWIDDPAPMPKDLAALTNAMVGPAPSLRDPYATRCQ